VRYSEKSGDAKLLHHVSHCYVGVTCAYHAKSKCKTIQHLKISPIACRYLLIRTEFTQKKFVETFIIDKSNKEFLVATTPRREFV